MSVDAGRILEARDVSDLVSARIEELLVGLSHDERLRPRRVEEAVAFLGGMVSKHGLYRLAEANAIPHEKADGIARAGALRPSTRIFFTYFDLAQWRAARFVPIKSKAAGETAATKGNHERREDKPRPHARQAANPS